VSDIIQKLESLKDSVGLLNSEAEHIAFDAKVDDIIKSVSDLENHVIELGERDV
jgi:hypothetical protein